MLDARLKDADLVVTTGGGSAGAFEVVKDALRAEDVEFVKVAMQPGMPQGAGRYEGVASWTGRFDAMRLGWTVRLANLQHARPHRWRSPPKGIGEG